VRERHPVRRRLIRKKGIDGPVSCPARRRQTLQSGAMIGMPLMCMRTLDGTFAASDC
jgi:hypothetical protein